MAPADLVLPVFVKEGIDEPAPIGSMPGVVQHSLDSLRKAAHEAAEAGIDPEFMHRVASLAAGGFDALPHNGAVITVLAVTGLTHRQSYANVAMVTIVLPVAALITVITLGTLFGSF